MHRDLAGVLDLPQRLDGARGAHQLDLVTCRLGQRRVGLHGHDVALETEPAHPVGRRTCRQMRPTGPLDDDFGVRRLLGRLGAVAPVCGQYRRGVVDTDEQRRIGSGESGEVTHVDQVGHEHGVEIRGSQALP